MSNHLASERSPYLLQHAENPVDWYPWGEAAFEKARREQKPVFLSIGYATCHWCHVMARESFESEAVARILNQSFVSVKVDREERPDVDAVYMEACTALNGSGGWPLTIIMTPEKQPFFAGTYLPRENRGRQLGLIPLLQAVAAKWERDRAGLTKTAGELTAYLNREGGAVSGTLDPSLPGKAYEQLRASFDKEYGGFGTAPKFPTPQNLLFLLRYAALSGEKAARQMAEQTLQQMARGGIYDQFGGGFARYSTDREWLAPHFEKTLYDNALLALCYTEAWQEGHFALYRRVSEETLDYCLRELRSPPGRLYQRPGRGQRGGRGQVLSLHSGGGQIRPGRGRGAPLLRVLRHHRRGQLPREEHPEPAAEPALEPAARGLRRLSAAAAGVPGRVDGPAHRPEAADRLERHAAHGPEPGGPGL